MTVPEGYQFRKVLVTGATGFIGCTVVDVLLAGGRVGKVVIASRSQWKAEELIAARPDFRDRLSYALIDDFESTAGGLDTAAEGCDGIIHVASPLSYDIKDNEKELILPAIAGVKAVMEAAAKAKTVRRVVLTSSFASVMDVSRGPGPGFTYTGKDWNPLTYEEACKGDAVVAYRGSKKFAELAAWDFIKEHSDTINFDLVTLCPPMTFGKICHPIGGLKDLNVSNAVLWSIVQGVDPLPVSRVPVWVSVDDLAEAHCNALLIPEAGGKRYVPASPEKFTYQRIADIIREKFPWTKNRVTLGNPGEAIPESYDLDGQAVADELKVKYTSLEDTIYNAIYQFAQWKDSGIPKEDLDKMVALT